MLKKIFIFIFLLFSCSTNNNINNSPLINLQDIKELSKQRLNGEFKINTNDFNSLYPKVTSDSKGNFVVSWLEETKIKARIFYSDKNKKSLEFLVSDSPDINNNTRVSCFFDKDIIFSWNAYDKDKDNYIIKLKIFSNEGKEKLEITLNNPDDISKLKTKLINSNFYTPIQEHKFFIPNINIFSKDNLLVIAYNTFSDKGNSKINIDIIKENKKNKEIIISDINNNYLSPKIIIYDNKIYISYLEYENNKIELKDRKTNIYFRIYDIDKDKLLEPIKINNIKYFSEDIFLEKDNNNNFIIVWATYSKSKYSRFLEDSYSEGIYLQKIDKDGNLINKNVKIINESSFIQSNPKIKFIDENYFLTWQKEDILKGDKFIYARILNKDFSGKEIKVSDINYNNDYDLNIVNKELILVWDSFLNFDDISQILGKKFKIIKERNK